MTLRIRNWDKWQSYRSDRGLPPWIKVHRQVMRDPNWVALTDAQRGQLVSLWILAADKAGDIPSDSKLLKKLCFLDDPPDIDRFIELGFLECGMSDVNLTSDRRQDDAPEKRRGKVEEEEERKQLSEPAAPVTDLSKKSSQSRKVLPYPDDFTTFWRAYPTDSIMSKKNALAAWQRLSAEDRVNATKAIPAFKAYCASNPTYRPVHAERFLNQRRFEQLLAANAGPGSSVSDELRRMQQLERMQHAEAGSA